MGRLTYNEQCLIVQEDIKGSYSGDLHQFQQVFHSSYSQTPPEPIPQVVAVDEARNFERPTSTNAPQAAPLGSHFDCYGKHPRRERILDMNSASF